MITHLSDFFDSVNISIKLYSEIIPAKTKPKKINQQKITLPIHYLNSNVEPIMENDKKEDPSPPQARMNHSGETWGNSPDGRDAKNPRSIN